MNRPDIEPGVGTGDLDGGGFEARGLRRHARVGSLWALGVGAVGCCASACPTSSGPSAARSELRVQWPRESSRPSPWSPRSLSTPGLPECRDRSRGLVRARPAPIRRALAPSTGVRAGGTLRDRGARKPRTRRAAQELSSSDAQLRGRQFQAQRRLPTKLDFPASRLGKMVINSRRLRSAFTDRV